MNKQERVLIFSHENDIDGIGNIVLAKITFKDVDYVLAPNPIVLDEKFRKYLEEGSLYQYDRIYVTDLTLSNETLRLISKDKNLSKKFLEFDHHKSAIDAGCDKYDFTTIKVFNDNGEKSCATELFYSYLIKEELLSRTNILDEFVEYTRLEDTWEWKEKGIIAHDLAILFSCLGIEKYIENMLIKLLSNQDSFIFTEEEQKLIDKKKKEYLEALKIIWSNREYFRDSYGNNYVGVFADYEYRNEIAEYATSQNEKDLKYVVIVALDKGKYGQKSYRSIEKEFDVSKIAQTHGGYGHKAASSVNITEEQKRKALVLRKTSNRDSLKFIIESSYKE